MEVIQTISHCAAFRILFSKNELAPIWKEVNEMLDTQFQCAETYNHKLAGNIEREFKLIKSHSYIEKLLTPMVGKHINSFHYMKEMSVLSGDVPIVLDSSWVNFQKKHEFNPIHMHGGVFSFVIWLKIPFSIEKELEASFCKNPKYALPGYFQFFYVGQEDGTLGIKTIEIGADEKFENQGLLFPSSLRHAVYPFFTSDDYRISVSGNFTLKV